jgi:tetratricopeptide (TPR) repeat protein
LLNTILNEKNACQKPIAAKKIKNPFLRYPGQIIEANTDILVENLWLKLLPDKYQCAYDSKEVVRWKDKIDNWHGVAISESGLGVGQHISSRIMYAVGDFPASITHSKRAIDIAVNTDNKRAYASEMGNLAMAHSAMNDFDSASNCLDISIPMCKELNHIQGISAQLQARARIYHLQGENLTAVKLYQEALYYARLENDEEAISNVMGNVGNAYNALGLLDESIKSVEEAITISQAIGNLQGLSSQLGIIAMSYHLKRDVNTAIRYCEEGIRIKKNIGDRNGEAMMLGVLINMYYIADRHKDALSISTRCQMLAKQTGNKEAERNRMIMLALLANQGY